MKKLIKSIVVCCAVLAFVSCNKTDDPIAATPPKAYSEVIPGEVAEIEQFLDNFNMQVDTDQNVSFQEITPKNGLKSIRSEYGSRLKYKTVNYDGYDFKVYFVQHTSGVNADMRPCPVDSAFVAYKGFLLKKKTGYDDSKSFDENQTFDEKQNPFWFNLGDARLTYGFRYMLYFLLPGNHAVDAQTNVMSFSDYGSSVVFLPSGLAYYEKSQGMISAYSPLIFNLKLMKVNFIDNDLDRVDSRDEEYELESDPLKFENNPWKSLKKDTDGDGYLDFKDQDDDNDGVKTIDEMKNPNGGFYTFVNVPNCLDGKKKIYSKQCH